MIELLVVVAIIALLIAMLLPSMDKARGTSRMLKCQTILRQIGVASSFYSADFNDFFLPQSVPTPFKHRPYTEWFQMDHFQRSMGIPAQNPARSAYNTPAGLICPDAAWVLNNPGTNEDKFALPSSTPTTETKLYRLDLTYGHNPTGLPGWQDYAAKTVRGFRHSKMRAPAARMFYMDSLWSDPLYGHRFKYADFGENYIPSSTGTYWGIAWRHLATREQGITNVLFFDGHVEDKTAGYVGDLNDHVLWHVYGY